MSVRAYMSGVESQQHFEVCMNAGTKHVLMSYMYLAKQDPMLLRNRKKANPDVHFMIDSGAHSFLDDKNAAKYANWSRQDFENYVIAYVEWLKKNREYITSAVELDIDYRLNVVVGNGPASSIGTSIVQEWQKKYFMPLLEQGMDICFVWHTERKMEGWEEMCSKFPYVGLPGEMSSQPDFNKYMMVARRYMTRVHGFAATKQADYRDWPWYSIDSITWKTAEMYGTLIHWTDREQKLTFEPDKPRWRDFEYVEEMKRRGFDAQTIQGIVTNSNYKALTKYALQSMRLMEAFYERRYAHRTFYYERRLPHPQAVLQNVPNANVARLWASLKPRDLFKHHANEQNIGKLRSFLAAVACIQYKEDVLLKTLPDSLKFLEAYFPKLVTPSIADPLAFQKELAMYLSPPNPPPLARVDKEHYFATNNAPKPREAEKLTLTDLEDDVENVPIDFSEI